MTLKEDKKSVNNLVKKLHLRLWNPFRQSMFIMGKSQTGKTRTGKIITKLLITSKRPVIVFDPNCRWTEKREGEIAFSPENVVIMFQTFTLRDYVFFSQILIIIQVELKNGLKSTLKHFVKK